MFSGISLEKVKLNQLTLEYVDRFKIQHKMYTEAAKGQPLCFPGSPFYFSFIYFIYLLYFIYYIFEFYLLYFFIYYIFKVIPLD